MEIALRQISVSQVRALLESGTLVDWAGSVHPGALPPSFVLQRSLAKISSGEPALWWLPFLVIESAKQAIAGGCAFKGPPVNGRAEVLYGVSRVCRGRGIASAAVAKLAATGFARGAAEVLAEIEPGNAGSIGVARKCGFTALGERVAEDGALVEQWLLRQR